MRLKTALALTVCGIAWSVGAAGRIQAQEEHVWWSATVSQMVERGGSNRTELLRALRDVPPAQRESLQFLLENMSGRDLQGLSADFLLTNVALATEAWSQAPWAQAVPKDIFQNDVLPYANAGERREPWRADLRTRCLPLIEGCTTPGQAAQRLNETIFGSVKVKYSTARVRADQSPAESMGIGLASCTGLSILLVDACRAVGVPARLAGIPDWSDGRGNHTWVEVWDAGQWYFLGAAEPDKRGLDHAWFERDAALAQKDSPRHAIYAVSFRRTELPFPLAWGPDSGEVSAENVTDRYTAARAEEGTTKAATTRVMIRVREGKGGPRVNAGVRVRGVTDPGLSHEGASKDEGADTNDMLSFDLPPGQTFDLNAEHGGRRGQQRFVVSKDAPQVMEVVLEESEARATSLVKAAPGSVQDDGGMNPAANPVEIGMKAALADFFAAPPHKQAAWRFDSVLDQALADDPEGARRLAWDAYRQAPAQIETKADFDATRVRFGEHVSPYTLRRVGEKPAGGWGLVIAMHGGGGAPKEVNDSQWRIMQSYYRDQPDLGGYLYVALRAPNDTWNGFYDDYVYPLIGQLIRQLAVGEDVDLDRVYLIGYSHGGYGAFAIGPKMPDRFAAIHSSAAAPTDGLISPKTLRNTAFDFAVGEFDDAYDRRKRCETFFRSIQALRGDRTDVFPVTFSLVAGRHHSDLPDHGQLREMLPARRNPVPRELTWEETDGVIKSFYWLTDSQSAKGREIDAVCRDNRLAVTMSAKTGDFTVLLDERLIDFHQPLVVEHDGRQERFSVKPSLLTLCATLLKRGDIGLAFTCRVDFEADTDGKLRAAATGVEP